MQGFVVVWNDALGQGQIRNNNGTFAFQVRSCTPRLRSRLSGHTIPPGQPVPVTFQFDPISNQAINVDLAGA
jgi:hypothetical protein